MQPTVRQMREATRDEWLAFIRRFPNRTSYRTGICEPPQEHCVNDGALIARVVYPMNEPQQYFISTED